MNFKTQASIAAIAATAVLPILIAMTASAYATAGPGQTVHLNGEGRKICRALADRNAPYWDAKVRGRYNSRFAGSDRFTVRTCFESRAGCLDFTNRFRHYVQGVEAIYYARCEAR